MYKFLVQLDAEGVIYGDVSDSDVSNNEAIMEEIGIKNNNDIANRDTLRNQGLLPMDIGADWLEVIVNTLKFQIIFCLYFPSFLLS